MVEGSKYVAPLTGKDRTSRKLIISIDTVDQWYFFLKFQLNILLPNIFRQGT
jgi:hypothetical protein